MRKKSRDPSISSYAQGGFSGGARSVLPFSGSGGEFAELGQNMLIRFHRTIENHVVPRLMFAARSDAPVDESAAPAPLAAADLIDEFVHLVLSHDAPVATEFVSTLRATGVPLASIYLELLTPAARRLGEMWDDDECSFTDVTIGVCRMHQVLLQFSRCFDTPIANHSSNRNVLVLPAHGEQHTFGLLVVMEFLRREGWDCFSGTPATNRDFETLVDAQNYDAIGISVSADRHIDRAASQVRWIRTRSRNRGALLLVGGNAVRENPELVATIGADGTADNGEDAARLFTKLNAGRGENSANQEA